MTIDIAGPQQVTAPGPHGTSTETLAVAALDGTPLNLHHVTSSWPVTKGPVILVHGAGVRADIFRPPGQVTLVDLLLQHGWDVWLENWRASIDLEPTPWTLDQAAAFDHPALVQRVCEETGADSVKAVIHCQGSTSFAMSTVAGLLPQVETIVANAVTLHPVVPAAARAKLLYLTPVVARITDHISPRWGLDNPTRFAAALSAAVRATHHECDHIVCRMVSFTYGVGFPCLWSHANLTPEVHDWIEGEFADVSLNFFAQMGRSVRVGHLVSDLPGLPSSYVAAPPRTDARFALFAGADNRCFLPQSQQRTYDFLDGHAPGRHSLTIVPGYGHLDIFFGARADRDVFPLMIEELST